MPEQCRSPTLAQHISRNRPHVRRPAPRIGTPSTHQVVLRGHCRLHRKRDQRGHPYRNTEPQATLPVPAPDMRNPHPLTSGDIKAEAHPRTLDQRARGFEGAVNTCNFPGR
jgi:hypothetical protein